ncbi:MAG: ribosome-associated translation inhibitor RaiA [Bifidobacteriaceae bacterium]|jgi:ribosomal subunit interface protein|nr:ribosome-associated translation inhibitor RaiA [Bifidobacteriaceae bacterium]
MEIQISGKNTKLDQKFKETVEKKISKVPDFLPHANLVHIELKEEKNPRRAGEAEKVEITITGKGSIHRSTASGLDRYSALDEAIYKLYEQLRRAHDKLLSLRDKSSLKFLEIVAPEGEELKAAKANVSEDVIEEMAQKYNKYDEIPLSENSVVRSKVHETRPMTVEEAIYKMEMLGHPFFIFVNLETSRPAVVYSRKSWNYGVLELDVINENAQN